MFDSHMADTTTRRKHQVESGSSDNACALFANRLLLIIAKQNADLQLDEVEGGGADAVSTRSSEQLDIAALGEREDGQDLALGVD